MARIPVAGPWVTEREAKYVAEAALEGFYSKASFYVQRFEKRFCEYLGVRHAAAVPHCTAALHLALAARGIGPGDEVIVPEITWIASAAPATYVGADIVFADVDRRSWCMSPESVERCVTDRTKAIIPVDLYGRTADMLALRDIAQRRHLYLVEDAAQALGARIGDRLAGTFGDVGAFSFHGTKTVTTGGEGGLLVTDDDALFERVLVLRDHGRTAQNFKFFYNTEIGFKYRMSSLQAAFGTAQLERIEELVNRKREIFRWYAARLADVPGLELNEETPGTFNTFWMVTAVVDKSYGLTTKALMEAFDKEEIDTRPFFNPLSALPAFGSMPDAAPAAKRNEVAYDLASRALNLPSAMSLTESDVDRVSAVFRRILGTR